MFDQFFKISDAPEVISSIIVMAIIVILAIIIGIQAHFQDPLKKPKGLLLLAEIGVKFFDNFVEGLIGTRLTGFGGIVMCCGVYLFISFIFGFTSKVFLFYSAKRALKSLFPGEHLVLSSSF